MPKYTTYNSSTQINGSKNYMVVGSDGFIGSALSKYFLKKNRPFIGTTKTWSKDKIGQLFLDLSNIPNHWEYPNEISTVFFCAGITSIKTCQENPQLTRTINVENTLKLIHQFIKNKIHVIYLSTNMVFDGSKPRSAISDHHNPKTEYGMQKAEVETKLFSLDPRFVTVVRLTKIIDYNLPLFRDWVKALNNKWTIHPFSDLVMSPLPLNFVVDVLNNIAEKKLTGILHVSGLSDIKYNDFARLIAETIGADVSCVKPIKAAESIYYYDLLPKNTTLSTDLLCTELKVKPPNIQEAADFLLKDILNNK